MTTSSTHSHLQHIQQIEGATAFIFCNFSMKMNDDIFHQPWPGLAHLNGFRVCNRPIFPDCVLKIIFGATGLFDPATQISIVRCRGHVCNIRIR